MFRSLKAISGGGGGGDKASHADILMLLSEMSPGLYAKTSRVCFASKHFGNVWERVSVHHMPVNK